MRNGFMDRNGRMEREDGREIGSAVRATPENVIFSAPRIHVGTDNYRKKSAKQA